MGRGPRCVSTASSYVDNYTLRGGVFTLPASGPGRTGWRKRNQLAAATGAGVAAGAGAAAGAGETVLPLESRESVR